MFTLAGCASHVAKEPAAPPPRAVAPRANHNAAAKPPVDSARPDATRAEALVNDALAKTSRIRELDARGPVHGVSLSRIEMAAHVRASIEHEVPASVVEAEGEVLIALGVAPPTFDYMAAIVSLMSAELAGYYEPSNKSMYLASDLGNAESEATLAHELVHALQDQHYDLGKLLEYRPDESDAQAALHALAEGDATSAMLDSLLLPQGKIATDLSEDLLGLQVRAAAQFSTSSGPIPEILKRSLIAPYVDGIQFVHWLRRHGGWAMVDRAWQSPPASTEQLLHPEKYIAREPPLAVAAPVPLDGTMGQPVYTDVLGEESFRLLFEEWMPRHSALEAAEGWGGDRGAVFREGNRVAVAWRLRCDDRDAATRAMKALLRGIAAQRGDTPSPEGLECAERATVGPLLVSQRGRDIAIVAGPYERRASGPVSAGSCAIAHAWAARILGS